MVMLQDKLSFFPKNSLWALYLRIIVSMYLLTGASLLHSLKYFLLSVHTTGTAEGLQCSKWYGVWKRVAVVSAQSVRAQSRTHCVYLGDARLQRCAAGPATERQIVLLLLTAMEKKAQDR